VLTNSGTSALQFSATVVESEATGAALWVRPSSGLLAPGEKVDVEVTVGMGAGPSVWEPGTLDAVVLIHLHRGRDLFLAIRAEKDLAEVPSPPPAPPPPPAVTSTARTLPT
jgi:hypothetical protein